MNRKSLGELRLQLSVGAKNGIDFTMSASLIWLAITFIWTLDFSAYHRAVFVFIAGGAMLPIAYLLSRAFNSHWSIENNHLQPLGLWLNIAQLFYFPTLVFTMIKMPDYFIMVYAIITGAHLFPYAWFYKTNWYAVFAGIIACGSLLVGLQVGTDHQYMIGAMVSSLLLVLTICLYLDYRSKSRSIIDDRQG